MQVGTQFSGTLGPSATIRWFTHSWPPDLHVVWTVVPTSPAASAPQLEWDVAVQRASPTALTYWITVKNLTTSAVNLEGRYEILS